MAERFKCLSFTLEMPFKDTQDCQDSVHGWNPVRPTFALITTGLGRCALAELCSPFMTSSALANLLLWRHTHSPVLRSDILIQFALLDIGCAVAKEHCSGRCGPLTCQDYCADLHRGAVHMHLRNSSATSLGILHRDAQMQMNFVQL